MFQWKGETVAVIWAAKRHKHKDSQVHQIMQSSCYVAWCCSSGAAEILCRPVAGGEGLLIQRKLRTRKLSRLSNKLQNPALIGPAHSVSDLICFYLAELSCWRKCGRKDPECRAKRGADRGVRGLSAAALGLFA